MLFTLMEILLVFRYSGEIRSYSFNETSPNWNTTTGPEWTGQPNESLTSEEIIQLRRFVAVVEFPKMGHLFMELY